MKILLARHAQTNYNVLKLANADPAVDVHLSEEGIRQAETLARLLENTSYDVVYISELPRTRETADIINRYQGKELIVDKRINENRHGFEGEAVEVFVDALNNAKDPWNAKFNDGESLNEAANRVFSFVEELKTKPYESVLIVTHGYITKVLFSYFEAKTSEEAIEFDLPQGTYIEFAL